MRHIKNILFFCLLFFYHVTLSQTAPNSLFESLKAFYNEKANCRLNKRLFTKHAKNDSLPFNYVYVSFQNSVKNALAGEAYKYAGPDAGEAARICSTYAAKGYSFFQYKTFGNSAALITKNLLNYSNESKAFLIFHELTHNYIIEKKIKMDYLLNEAACDVIAVMFSQQFLKERQVLDPVKLDEEVASLETVYTVINETIAKIKEDSLSCPQYCMAAEQKISAAIKGDDAFFKDRFLYPVNTAYLLKNSNYCKYYSEVKHMYLASKDFKDFMKALTSYQNLHP